MRFFDKIIIKSEVIIMVVTKEKKVVYDVIDIDKADKAFCEQIYKLATDAIIDKVVSPYYQGHKDELLAGFIQDIANAGELNMSDYE